MTPRADRRLCREHRKPRIPALVLARYVWKIDGRQQCRTLCRGWHRRAFPPRTARCARNVRGRCRLLLRKERNERIARSLAAPYARLAHDIVFKRTVPIHMIWSQVGERCNARRPRFQPGPCGAIGEPPQHGAGKFQHRPLARKARRTQDRPADISRKLCGAPVIVQNEGQHACRTTLASASSHRNRAIAVKCVHCQPDFRGHWRACGARCVQIDVVPWRWNGGVGNHQVGIHKVRFIMATKSQRHRSIGNGPSQFRKWARQLFSRIPVSEQYLRATLHKPTRDSQSTAKLPEPHDGDAAAIE